MPQARPKRAAAPKAFDVFKPGKSLASPTSRPVIASRKPQVQDSTLTSKPGKPVSNAHSTRKLMNSHDKVTVPSPAEETPSASAARPITSSEPPVDNEPKPPAEPLLPPVLTDPGTAADEDQKPELPTQADEPVPAELEYPAATQDVTGLDQNPVTPTPIVDSAQIVVSHHKPAGRSKWKGLAVALLIIVLAALAIDVILDAGVWKPNYNIPHTHIIGR